MRQLMWTFVVAASLAAPLPAAGQHAVPRGGGGSDSGGGSPSSGGSSSGGSSSGGSTSSGGSSDGGSTYAPPRHPGGSSSSGRSGGSSGTASARGRGGSSAGSGSDRVVPETGGRTRDGRPITGYAVPRGTVVPEGRPGGDFYYYPRGRNWYHVPYYYSPYYYAGFGAGFWGLGYIWDPFWWGPGFDPWYGGGFGGYAFGGGGGGGSSNDDYEEPTEGTGALRIKVKPREAKVLVDGTVAGVVDDFDGNFQKLRLDPGSHSIELQAEGYQPLKFDVLIVEDQTVTYKGKLREH